MTYVVIFGGEDAESATARCVAATAGCIIATAVTADGRRVHNGNAYQAVSFVVDDGRMPEGCAAIIFECSLTVAGALEVVAKCDHHNPGDAGWGKGADQFWEASSLGQLCLFLGVSLDEHLLMVAAGDHCPAAAYAGLCVGVDPAKFADFRVKGKVAFYASNPKTSAKADADKIRDAMATAVERLTSAPQIEGVCDLREVGEIDELPEAALSVGMAYMASLPDTDRDRNLTGNLKIVLGGHTTPEQVRKFMEWGNTLDNKVGAAYGNPDRGYAGVVVEP